MPRLAKWLADGTEKIFQSMLHPVEVEAVEMLQTDLKRVRFVGDLARTKHRPGQVIEFRINANDFRHYTPSHYDSKAGVCEVLFYLHGKGPGSRWARELRPGNALKLMGPGGKLRFQTEASHHFFFGDESSLGLYAQLKDIANRYETEYLCLLELDAAHTAWPQLLELEADVIGKSVAQPAEAAIDWLKGLDAQVWRNWRGASFYLTGRAASIKHLRKALRARGVGPRQILAQPYWADHKRGL
ncbi:MAG: siderophore-interacting protein [Bacteroidota bacterium]